MSLDYIAAIGRFGTEIVARVRKLNGYSIVLDRPGMLVACAEPADLIDLGHSRGLVLGTLFDRAARAPRTEVDEASVVTALADRGATLCARFWGSYIAFLAPNDEDVSVLRDPSGAAACYFARSGGACILSSNVRVAAMHGLMPQSIDFTGVAQHLLWPERRRRRTCIVGVDELLPGESLSATNDAISVQAMWTPWQFTARAQQFETTDEAVELVRRATLNTISAWCTRYRKPLISLSGGLDSSIVLASVREAVGAVTFTTGEGLGDERAFAHAAAEHRSISLLEYPLELDAIDADRSAAAALPRPNTRLFEQELDRRWREATQATTADALFHGGGGDNVFCYLASATPYVDSLLVRGPGRASAATLDCLSALTRVSKWRVRRAALRKVLIDRGHYRWFRDPRLLSRSAIKRGSAPREHPWFADLPRTALPGKRAHVAAIIRIQNYLDPIEPASPVPHLAPLMSQPIVETCLRVPTWMWCDNGANRAIAREAFRNLLPAKIVDRRGKGSPAAFDARIVATHRAKFRAMLHDGMLAREQLIDRAAVGAALAGEGPLRGELYQRVTELVDVEAWLQSWDGLARVQN